jgi:hypothetical protein
MAFDITSCIRMHGVSSRVSYIIYIINFTTILTKVLCPKIVEVGSFTCFLHYIYYQFHNLWL